MTVSFSLFKLSIFSFTSQEIYKTTCCNQYICRLCILSYCQGKGDLPETLLSLPKKLPPIRCPYCVRNNVNFLAVSTSEKVKSYEDSPRIFQLRNGNMRSDSPLRIGDTFDRMKVCRLFANYHPNQILLGKDGSLTANQTSEQRSSYNRYQENT